MSPNWKKLAMSSGLAVTLLGTMTYYFEGNSLTPYRDVGGIWTDCEGNTHNVDPRVRQTQITCQGINQVNQQEAIDEVNRVVSVPLTRNQQLAFGDFIYNEGTHTFTTSCNKKTGVCRPSTMYTHIQSGQVLQGCKDLLQYVYAGDKKLPGLIARRQAEYTICITADPT